MREARQERGAEFLELLADNLAAAGAGRGAHAQKSIPSRPWIVCGGFHCTFCLRTLDADGLPRWQCWQQFCQGPLAEVLASGAATAPESSEEIGWRSRMNTISACRLPL